MGDTRKDMKHNDYGHLQCKLKGYMSLSLYADINICLGCGKCAALNVRLKLHVGLLGFTCGVRTASSNLVALHMVYISMHWFLWSFPISLVTRASDPNC